MLLHQQNLTVIITAISVALIWSFILVAISLSGFSRTGPQLKKEIIKHYTWYSALALIRLAFWAFVLSFIMATFGVLIYISFIIILGFSLQIIPAFLCGLAGLILLTTLQFFRVLLFSPGTIAISFNYRFSRFYRLWQWLSPSRIQIVQQVILLSALGIFGAAVLSLFATRQYEQAITLLMVMVILGSLVFWGSQAKEPAPVVATRKPDLNKPNIVMIGADTLRADRLGILGYPRNVSPCLDNLAQRGILFSHCFVPCARTAPSLISLLTGVWPHKHGIRDNFVVEEETKLPVPSLVQLLSEAGYHTAAISDWAGGDLGKFQLGFEQLDLPHDQWNIKYLIRQGPKDIRLFLTLFTHNRFGKHFLPELYYLAGIPLTQKIGRDVRVHISQLAAAGTPFMLNAFMATTHPPFASEYPYYGFYADPNYAGESKFVMSRLRDPFEIIRRQGDGRKEFDLEQIINLYDGCVKSFDDEVAKIVRHIKACGLEENTIIVIYSDHGIEFFENNTWGQGNSVQGDSSSKIPLIIVDPRRLPASNVTKITRSIDVAPTLLELVDVPIPEAMDGVSLVPYMEGKDKGPDLVAYSETGIWLTKLPGIPVDHLRYPDLPDLLDVTDKKKGTLSIKSEFKNIVIQAKDRMIRTDRWKLIYFPMKSSAVFKLFDTVNDPECLSDVSDQYPEVFDELKQKLVAWIADDPAVKVTLSNEWLFGADRALKA